MSRYLQLQKLLGPDALLEKLSFYPPDLIDFRYLLKEWIEAQDWSSVVLYLSGETLVERSKSLLQEAFSKLQEKPKNGGADQFYVYSTVTKLKKAYTSQPEKFVEKLHECLTKEEQLLNSMMAEAKTFENATVSQQMSAKDLLDRVAKCRQLDQRVLQVLRAASLCLKNWPTDIQNKSNIPRDLYGNGDTVLAPFLAFQTLREELEKVSHNVVQELKEVLRALEWYVVQWKTYKLHECVSRKVEGESSEMSKQTENMCEQVCASVYTLMRCASSNELQMVEKQYSQLTSSSSRPSIPAPSLISWFCLALKDILKTIVEMFLVVLKQPPLTMMIEKEKGQRDREDINNSKKFTTTVGILGGKGFEAGIDISEVEIYLAFSADLANAQQMNKRPENVFKIYHDRPDARRQYSTGDPESTHELHERTYEKLRVELFSRKETKHVYKQLYHVVYDVRLNFPLFMFEVKTQTISLPIIVRTGANQASEHIGAQLWHSFSSPNVYNLHGKMAASMEVSKVIQMMNERIKFIGGEGLRDYEKEFLMERLQMVAGGKGSTKSSSETTITLDNFIKDKVSLPRHGSTAGAMDVMDFSLWRWLHSIINLLEAPENLRQPWIDGVIYGFASRQQCKRALERSLEGTFLLRFSESALHGNHIMSKGGLAAVIQRNGVVDFAPPVSAEDIEQGGLGKVLACKGCQFLYRTQLTINEVCQKYPPANPPENPTSGRYRDWFDPRFAMPGDSGCNGASQIGSPNPHGTGATTAKRPYKKPKRSSQKALASDIPGSKQHRAAAPNSPDSTTTSSLASPQAMSPESNAHFQAVGVQEIMSPSGMTREEVSSPNIPVPVLSHMNGGHDMTGMIDDAQTLTTGQPSTMILEFPDNQLNDFQYMDISGTSGTPFPAGITGSAPSFDPNTELSIKNDPSVILNSTWLLEGEAPIAMSLEEVNEFLSGNADPQLHPQQS